MSLVEPKIWDKVWAHRKLIAIVAGLVVVLLAVWAGVTWFGEWQEGRTTVRKRANVNTAFNQMEQANANVAAAQKELVNATANVAVAADDYLESINVTDGTREAVNAAIERQKLAANVNKQANAADVENAMRGL